MSASRPTTDTGFPPWRRDLGPGWSVALRTWATHRSLPRLPGLVAGILASCWISTLRATPASAQVESVIRVEVREAGTERPLGDVQVEVVGGALAPVWTGSDGMAVLRGLPPGSHTLRARLQGYESATRGVEVLNGVRRDVSLRLQPRPVELEGLQVEARGAPEGARILDPDGLGPEARTLADAVERLPGVDVIRRGGPGTPTVPTIRGSSGDQVLVLVDGVAINSPLTGEADLSQVTLDDVVRVMVVPGARAGRYGPGALAGAIVIETRSPDASTARARLETGSLGSWAFGGSATVARSRSDWRWSMGGEWSRTRGDFEYPVPEVRGGGMAIRDNADVEGASGWAETVWDPAAGPRLRLRVHARRVARGSPGTVVQPSLTGRNQERRLGALLQGDGGDAHRGWSAAVSVDRTDALFHDPEPPFGQPYRSESDVRQFGGRGEARLRWGAVDLEAGADGRLQDVTSTTLDVEAPGTVKGLGGWMRGRWAVTDRDRSLEVTGSLRTDLHDLLDGIVASPALSVLLGVGGTSFEATVGSSVSPPDISDLFFQEGVLARANPGLSPERVRGEVELRLRQEIRGVSWSGAVAVAAFRADVDGMILWFPDHRFVWSPTNVDVRRRGLEASGEIRAGRLTSLRGDVGWTRVEYAGTTPGGQVVYRPEFTADLAADLAWVGLDWTARWRWIGARRTSPGTSQNQLPGYGRIDAGVRRPFRLRGVGVSVELGVNNLLDDRASLLADYPLPGRTLTLRVRAGTPGA
ncbi:MAG: TonB-dependent receptor [Gemmatimonadota bacterium]